MWWVLVGCFSDPLESVGLAPVTAAPASAPAPTLDVPTTPPMDGAKVTGEGATTAGDAEGAGGGGGGATASGDAPPPPAPAAYNPISIPQGPRTEGGVKWEGVTKRGTGLEFKPNSRATEEQEKVQ
jgi:hypothetical protein